MSDVLKRIGVFVLVGVVLVFVITALVSSTLVVANNPRQIAVVHWGAVLLGAALIAFKGKFPLTWQLVIECTAVAAPAAVLIAEALQ